MGILKIWQKKRNLAKLLILFSLICIYIISVKFRQHFMETKNSKLELYFQRMRQGVLDDIERQAKKKRDLEMLAQQENVTQVLPQQESKSAG